MARASTLFQPPTSQQSSQTPAMAPTAETSRLTAPAKLDLALTLAIVQNKPTDEPVKGTFSSSPSMVRLSYKAELTSMSPDYILRIRSLIRRLKESNTTIDDKFFDSTRFWQSAFEKSQAEQTKLMDKIFELEQRNQALLTKVHGSPASDIKSPTSTKRKAAGIEENGMDTGTAKKRYRGRRHDIRSSADIRTSLNGPSQGLIELERR